MIRCTQQRTPIHARLLLLIVWMLCSAAAFAAGASEYILLGNASLGEGAVGEAIAHYEQARQESPGSPRALYNLGVALYREENYAAALSAFQSVRADSRPLATAVHYNLGNALARLGREQESADPESAVAFYQAGIAAYGRALELQPDHMGARYNMEVVRMWLADLRSRMRPAPGGQNGDQKQSAENNQGQSGDGNGDGSDSQNADPGQSPGSGGEQPELGPVQPDDSQNETARSILEDEQQRRTERQGRGGTNNDQTRPTW